MGSLCAFPGSSKDSGNLPWGRTKSKACMGGRLMNRNGNLGIPVPYPRGPSYHLLCPLSMGLRSELVLGNSRDGALLLEGRLKGWGCCEGAMPCGGWAGLWRPVGGRNGWEAAFLRGPLPVHPSCLPSPLHSLGPNLILFSPTAPFCVLRCSPASRAGGRG